MHKIDRRRRRKILRSIAVVNVEVHDGHPLPTMLQPRMKRADRNVVEHAKSHGTVPLGVVSGRADGAEGVRRFAFRDCIDGGADRTRRAQRRFARIGRKGGIEIEMGTAHQRDRLHYLRDIVAIMNVLEFRIGGPPRFPPAEIGEFRAAQRIEDGAQPLRIFRMAGTRIVVDASGMREDQCRHRHSWREAVTFIALGTLSRHKNTSARGLFPKVMTA